MQITPNPVQGYGIGAIKSTAGINATNLKATAGVVGGWNLANTTGSALYVKLYDQVAAPAPATDVPKIRLIIPANSYISHPLGANGWKFENGISYTIVAGAADTYATGVSSGNVIGAIGYV